MSQPTDKKQALQTAKMAAEKLTRTIQDLRESARLATAAADSLAEELASIDQSEMDFPEETGSCADCAFPTPEHHTHCPNRPE